MKVVAERARVAASPEQVWAVLADYGALARWAANVDHSSVVTEQTEGVGAVRRVQLGRQVLLERVVEWEPEAALAYTVEGLPRVVRGVVNGWRLEAAAGATQVTLTSRIDANPVVAFVVSRVLAGELRRLIAGLKAHVEGGA